MSFTSVLWNSAGLFYIVLPGRCLFSAPTVHTKTCCGFIHQGPLWFPPELISLAQNDKEQLFAKIIHNNVLPPLLPSTTSLLFSYPNGNKQMATWTLAVSKGEGGWEDTVRLLFSERLSVFVSLLTPQMVVQTETTLLKLLVGGRNCKINFLWSGKWRTVEVCALKPFLLFTTFKLLTSFFWFSCPPPPFGQMR